MSNQEYVYACMIALQQLDTPSTPRQIFLHLSDNFWPNGQPINTDIPDCPEDLDLESTWHACYKACDLGLFRHIPGPSGDLFGLIEEA